MTLTATTVADALDSALIALRAAQVDTPRLDAEVLLAHALGVDRAQLFLRPEAEVGGSAARWFRDAVRQRAVERVPVAYLTGSAWFRHLELIVDERVLIPRPETEHVVEAALELPHGARVHDIGTGSGAVALALKQERPDLLVSASDISPAAVAVARANARRLGLDVEFRVADLADGLEPVDAVMANLPYVATTDPLPPEVARHEPGLALLAGPDGLDMIRRLVAAPPAPWLALELGQGQADAVMRLLEGWRVEVRRDLAGIERVVVACRD